MTIRKSLRLYLAAAVATLLLCAQHAQACEGCKQSVGMGDGTGGSHVVNNTGLAFGLSIMGLLLTVVSILGGLGYMMYRNCQIIAAQQQAADQAAGLA